MWRLAGQEAYGRWAVDAAVRDLQVTVPEQGARTLAILPVRVLAGHVYGTGKLIQEPVFFYQPIFGEDRFWIQRGSAPGRQRGDTAGRTHELFGEVQTHLASTPAEHLTTPQQVVEATLAGAYLVARVAPDEAVPHRVLEFPIKHINVQAKLNLFQAETGPILLTHSTSATPRIGHVAFSSFHEWTTATEDLVPFVGGTYRFPGEVTRSKARIWVFAIRE